MRVGLAEGGAAAALELHRIVAGHDDPAARDDRNVDDVVHHAAPPETNSMNSLYAACDPAQVILSSPPSLSAKRRMVLAARGPFQPQGQFSSQCMVTSSPET